MENTSENRNILFGVVAIENELVSADQMQQVYRQWIKEKSTPVSDLFQKFEFLTDEQCRLIQSEVEQRINRLDRTLATPARKFDPAVTSSLQGFRADSDFQYFMASYGVNLFPDAPVSLRETIGKSSATGRFRVLRPYAKGGLGEVFVARDEELDREVALKQIQDDYADNAEQQDRFLREAEITGKLEHPGIVPVYGLGHDDNGRPYYVMRFIRGKSLRDAIRQFHDNQQTRIAPSDRNRELRRMLGWFIDVCEAIAYAHSRGVLHRDLKPGNIMLGRYGETLVVDWGLAKTEGMEEPSRLDLEEQPVRTHLGSGSSETMAGTALGTPAYMSPEQALGRLDLLGAQSDVYSLGATLYSILTGETPVTGVHAGEVLQKVGRGDFAPPHAIAPSISEPLEAICLKAMALRPDERYETPLELAADIESWLADAPVSAWREPVSVRARRWVKNHQPLVVGIAASIVVAMLGSLIASGFLSSKNRQLLAAKRLAEEKTVVAQQQTEIANQQTKVANEQSNLALATVTSVIRDFQNVFLLTNLTTEANLITADQLLAERAAARRNMIESALRAMRKVSTNLRNHSDYGDALVLAHLDLGDLFMDIGGEDFSDSRDEALQEYNAAEEVCKKWIEAEPENFRAKKRYGRVTNRLATHAFTVDDYDEAIRLIKQAIENSKQLIQQEPENGGGYRNLIDDYFAIGTYEFRMRYNMPKSVEWNKLALAVVEECNSKDIEILDDSDWEQLIPEIENRVAIFSSLAKIREDVEFAFTLREDLVARAIYDCAAWQLYDGEHEAAFKTLQRMDTMDNLSGRDFYQNACGFAKCGKAVLKGRNLEELSEEEADQVNRYSELAVKTLYKSKAGGFFEDAVVVGLLGRDDDLNTLRDRDDFKEFASLVRENAKPETVDED